MLEQIRARLRELLTQRADAQTSLDGVIAAAGAENRTDLTADEAAAVTEARSKIQSIDAEVETLTAREAELVADAERRAAAEAVLAGLPTPPAAVPAGGTGGVADVRVGREELTYRRGGPHSYFRDLAKSRQEAGGSYDDEAVARLRRHGQEMDVELRANMNRTDGTGGEFVPPLWLMEQYVPLARAGRVTADLCRKLPLPAGTDSINLPKVSTGTATAEQSDGGSAQKTDMTTTSVSGAVTTIAGQQVFAIQLLDQSPINFDEVVFADLLADLAVKIDTYVLNKASIGILNVSGIISVTYTDASPTVPELYPKVADAKQQVDTNRYLPAQAIVMHPRRWAWHLASLDSTNRPLVVPNGSGFNAFAGFQDVRAQGVVGELQGLPVYVDPNVPTNLGAGTNEDRVILARFDDLFLYEGAVRSRVLFETDADTLSVRLQVWEYLAFIGSRYPKSIAVVSGTGLVTPTF